MTATTQFEKFFRLEKMDEFQGIATGVAAAEEVDHDGEILDYFASKPYFQKWSESQRVASGGKSLGNVRLQHDPTRPVGRLLDLAFDDHNRMVRVTAKIEEAEAKNLLATGVLTGFSIGGDYIKKTPLTNGLTRYVAGPSEVSVCDRPCAPSAVFTAVKADGSIELRKFARQTTMSEMKLRETVFKLLTAGMSKDQVRVATGLYAGQLERVIKGTAVQMMKNHGLAKGMLGVRGIIANAFASGDKDRVRNLCFALNTDEKGLKQMLGECGIA